LCSLFTTLLLGQPSHATSEKAAHEQPEEEAKPSMSLLLPVRLPCATLFLTFSIISSLVGSGGAGVSEKRRNVEVV